MAFCQSALDVMQVGISESRPKVAIITRTKDRPLFLRRAMNSVLSQTLEDWVHVIVNDGGDAEVVDFLVRCEAENYRGRVLVIHHANGQGMQNASNAGVEGSSSDYLIIHDDDDSWQPEFLEKTVEVLENEPDGSVVRGVVTQSIQIFEEVQLDGNVVETGRQNYQPFEVVTLEVLRQRNLFAPIAFLYRRDVHEKIGLFRQEFDVLGDHDFNLRFIRYFDIAVIDEYHANYHWRHHSFGNTVTRQLSVHRNMLAKLKNAYSRDVLERNPNAVGLLNEIPMPPAQEPKHVHFKLRSSEPEFVQEMPDFEADYDFEVLSLDVFDTILLRRTYQPTDVFHVLEERAVQQLGLAPHPYALARKEAEARARRTVPDGEVKIDAIYEALGELIDLDSDALNQLRDLELQLEGEFLYADPRWVALYQKFRKMGKRIIFISDMYWPAGFLKDILTKFGFEDPELYVSCDCGVSKHHGKLQPYVIGKLGVPAQKILHVGDNFVSDYVRCRQAGMQAFHWKDSFIYRPWVEQVELLPRVNNDPFSLRLIGEARRFELEKPLDSSNDPLMERMGREVAGPLYYCFLNWVVHSARRDGVRHLFFLGRDGYYWEKAMQVLDQRHNLGLEFTYLHASRKVLSFASFVELDSRSIEFLSTPNPRLCVKDFIDRTGLDSRQFLEEIRSAGFSDPDEVLTTDLGGEFLKTDARGRLEMLFALIEEHLLVCFKRCREGLLQDLNSQSFDIEDSAIVDIGWQGSSANSLAHFLDLDRPNSLRAYYFGTWKHIGEVLPAVCPRSFFVHKDEPLELRNLLLQSVNFFETLHSAPFRTLLDYEHGDDGQFRPVFSECDRSGLSEDEQERLWSGVEVFLEAVSDIPFPLSEDQAGLNYLEGVLHRILHEPSPSERSRIGKIVHSEGYGLEVNKPLIMPLQPKMKGSEIMQGYWASNWKKGYLAELSEKQRNFVFARLTNNPASLDSDRGPTPWHKHVYRWYRRMMGDPKYLKRKN